MIKGDGIMIKFIRQNIAWKFRLIYPLCSVSVSVCYCKLASAVYQSIREKGI